MEGRAEIAIIGGGIAGLAAAYHLQKYNLISTVYEKRPKVGGRFSTLEVEGIYINRGALMFSKKFNPCFSEMIHELGIEYEQLQMSKFVLQDGDRLIPLNQWSIFKSGLFSLPDFLKWFRLKKLLRSLNFNFTYPDERLRRWHEMSLLKFCKKEMKLSEKMIDYFVQHYSSFAYVDPDEISVDHGLFLLSYSIPPCFSPKYRPFELLIFPKVRNTHGVHAGELRHLPDVRSICSIFLYRSDGDLGAVFDNYKIIERVG